MVAVEKTNVAKELAKASEPFEEKPVEGITIQKLDLLAREYRDAKDAVDEIKAEKDRAEKVVKNIEKRVSSLLEQIGRKSFKTAYGTMINMQKWSVRIPKDPEKLNELREYATELGVVESLFKPNHASLNSFYKSQMEAAVESGNIDFKVPGIDDPTCTTIVQLRKR